MVVPPKGIIIGSIAGVLTAIVVVVAIVVIVKNKSSKDSSNEQSNEDVKQPSVANPDESKSLADAIEESKSDADRKSEDVKNDLVSKEESLIPPAEPIASVNNDDFTNAGMLVASILYSYKMGSAPSSTLSGQDFETLCEPIIEDRVECLNVNVFWIICRCVPQLLPLFWFNAESECSIYTKSLTSQRVDISVLKQLVLSSVNNYVNGNLRTYLRNCLKLTYLKNAKVIAQKGSLLNRCNKYIQDDLRETTTFDDFCHKTQTFIRDMNGMIVDNDAPWPAAWCEWKTLYAASGKTFPTNVEITALPSNYPVSNPTYELYQSIILVANLAFSNVGSEVKDRTNQSALDELETLTRKNKSGICFDINRKWEEVVYDTLFPKDMKPWDGETYSSLSGKVLPLESIVGSDAKGNAFMSNTPVYEKLGREPAGAKFLSNQIDQFLIKSYINPTRDLTFRFFMDGINPPFRMARFGAECSKTMSTEFIPKTFDYIVNGTSGKAVIKTLLDLPSCNMATSIDYIHNTYSIRKTLYEKRETVRLTTESQTSTSKSSDDKSGEYMSNTIALRINQILFTESINWQLIFPMESNQSFGIVNGALSALGCSDSILPSNLWCKNNVSTTERKYANIEQLPSNSVPDPTAGVTVDLKQKFEPWNQLTTSSKWTWEPKIRLTDWVPARIY